MKLFLRCHANIENNFYLSGYEVNPSWTQGTSLIPWLLSICESLADKSFIIRSLLTLAVTSQSSGARSKDNKASCNKYFWFWKDLFQNCCFYSLEFWLPRDFIMMWILSASKYFHIASFHVLRICGRWKIIKKHSFPSHTILFSLKHPPHVGTAGIIRHHSLP